MARISNSKLDTYQQCPRKYKFKYLERVQADITRSPLLFGSAMDSALNFILECIRDEVPYSIEQACNIFDHEMRKWKGQNTLDYFKNELPELPDRDGMSVEEVEEAVWQEMCRRGINAIFVYEKEILPHIAKVLEVQTKGELQNEEGDTFEFVVDAVVQLTDGRVVLLDNKTSSSKYPKNKVIKSQQLSLYLESYPNIKYAGYAVLIKNPDKVGITHQFMVDEIPEETTAASFKLLEDTLLAIKQEKFPCNYKSCKAFGKPCEYERACSYGDYTGLVKIVYDKKKEEASKE
jgi:hypothetical protein